MKNKLPPKRIFILYLIIVLLVVALGLFLVNRKKKTEEDWTFYQNLKYGFSLSYPSSFFINENEVGIGGISGDGPILETIVFRAGDIPQDDLTDTYQSEKKQISEQKLNFAIRYKENKESDTLEGAADFLIFYRKRGTCHSNENNISCKAVFQKSESKFEEIIETVYQLKNGNFLKSEFYIYHKDQLETAQKIQSTIQID